MEAVATLLVFGTFTVFVLVASGTIVMAFTLRRRFPGLWKELGEPTEWLGLVRTSRDRHVFEFLQHREYRRTNDSAFIRICEALRAGWYLFFPLFVLALVCLLVVVLPKA
jgi:hypothetical protein